MDTDKFGDPKWVKNYEYQVGKTIIIPFLTKVGIEINKINVLDLGCGSGGILWALGEAGAQGTGIDRNPNRINEANQHIGVSHDYRTPTFQVGNILLPLSISGCFDLVLLVEVIEHLVDFENVNQTLFVASQCLCNQNGKILVTFPPYKSPFGGHQAGWPYISFLPWVHLWPRFILRKIIAKKYLDFLDKELNHITIEKFESCAAKSDLRVVKKAYFFIRPEYYLRYRVKPIQYSKFFERSRIINDYLTSGAYYLLERKP